MGNDESTMKSFRTYRGWQVTAADHKQANMLALATKNLTDPSEQTVLDFNNGMCGIEPSIGGAYKPQRGEQRFAAPSPLHETMDEGTIQRRVNELATGLDEKLTCTLCVRGYICGPLFPVALLFSCCFWDDFQGMDEFLKKKIEEYNAADRGALVWRLAQEAGDEQLCMLIRRVVTVKHGGGMVVLQQGMQIANVPLLGGGHQQVVLVPANMVGQQAPARLMQPLASAPASSSMSVVPPSYSTPTYAQAPPPTFRA